jgi:hypothetical protein
MARSVRKSMPTKGTTNHRGTSRTRIANLQPFQHWNTENHQSMACRRESEAVAVPKLIHEEQAMMSQKLRVIRKPVIMYLDPEDLRCVDEARGAWRIKTSRQRWLMEVIIEKLDREAIGAASLNSSRNKK